MRSDEAANEFQVERDQAFRGNVKKGVSAAASIAATVGGGPIAARVMPFLNQYIPADLAVKGISKVSPKLGSFLQKGQDMGLDIQEGLNFVKDKMGGQQEPAKQDKNIIQQYSPNLNRYLMDIIKNGDTPVAAAAKARKFLDKKQQDIIKKMESDHRVPWEQIVESIFGNGQTAQPIQSQGQQGQQQSEPGQGLDPSVQAILQQGAAILQNFKGSM